MKSESEKLEILRRGVAGEPLGWRGERCDGHGWTEWCGPFSILDIVIDWQVRDLDLWDNVKPCQIQDDDWLMRNDGRCHPSEFKGEPDHWRIQAKYIAPGFRNQYRLCPPEPNAEELKKNDQRYEVSDFRPPEYGEYVWDHRTKSIGRNATDELPSCMFHNQGPFFILRRIEKKNLIKVFPVYEADGRLKFASGYSIIEALYLPNFRGFKWKSGEESLASPWLKMNTDHFKFITHADFVLLEVDS